MRGGFEPRGSGGTLATSCRTLSILRTMAQRFLLVFLALFSGFAGAADVPLVVEVPVVVAPGEGVSAEVSAEPELTVADEDFVAKIRYQYQMKTDFPVAQHIVALKEELPGFLEFVDGKKVQDLLAKRTSTSVLCKHPKTEEAFFFDVKFGTLGTLKKIVRKWGAAPAEARIGGDDTD